MSGSLDTAEATQITESFGERYVPRGPGLETRVRRWDVIAFANCADLVLSLTDERALSKSADIVPSHLLEHVRSDSTWDGDHRTTCVGSHRLDSRSTNFDLLFRLVAALMNDDRGTGDTLLWIFSDGRHDPSNLCAESAPFGCGLLVPPFPPVPDGERAHLRIVLSYTGGESPLSEPLAADLLSRWEQVAADKLLDFVVEPDVRRHFAQDIAARMLQRSGIATVEHVGCIVAEDAQALTTTVKIGRYAGLEGNLRFTIGIAGFLRQRADRGVGGGLQTLWQGDFATANGNDPGQVSALWVPDPTGTMVPSALPTLQTRITLVDRRFHWDQRELEDIPCVPAGRFRYTLSAGTLLQFPWSSGPFSLSISAEPAYSKAVATAAISGGAHSSLTCPPFRWLLNPLWPSSFAAMSLSASAGASFGTGAAEQRVEMRPNRPVQAGCSIYQLRYVLNGKNVTDERPIALIYEGRQIEEGVAFIRLDWPRTFLILTTFVLLPLPSLVFAVVHVFRAIRGGRSPLHAVIVISRGSAAPRTGLPARLSLRESIELGLPTTGVIIAQPSLLLQLRDYTSAQLSLLGLVPTLPVVVGLTTAAVVYHVNWYLRREPAKPSGSRAGAAARSR